MCNVLAARTDPRLEVGLRTLDTGCVVNDVGSQDLIVFFNKMKYSTYLDIVNCNAVRIIRPKETKNGWIIETVADRTTNM